MLFATVMCSANMICTIAMRVGGACVSAGIGIVVRCIRGYISETFEIWEIVTMFQ